MPNNTMQTNDAKNKRIAAIIYIIGFAAIHAAAFFLSAHPNFTGWRIGLFGVALLAVIVLAIMFITDNEWIENYKWPQAIVVILAFASAVAIGYCPQC